MDAFLNKKYKLSSSDNFEAYMKAVGVSMMVRKVANNLSPVVELTKSGDEYTLTSTTSYKTSVIKFKDSVQSEQETADGRKVASTITINGTTLNEVQKDVDGKESTLDRIFSGDEIKMVMKIDDIVCTRVYKLQ